MAMQPTKVPPSKTSSKAPPPPPIDAAELNMRVAQLGNVFKRVQISDNNGRDTKDTKRVDAAYAEFQRVLEEQAKHMTNATPEQREVLNELVSEFAKLRKEGNVDFDRFYKEMEAAVARINELGGDQKAKEGIELAAAVGMKHSDPKFRKPKGGVLRQELRHRATKIFAPSKSDLESPLFRKLAGLDRKNKTGTVSPLERARILGQGEALKNAASNTITGGESEGSDAATSTEEAVTKAIVKVMGGSGGIGGIGGKGAFPSKIENLHVENLIVKSARREEATGESGKPPRYMQPQLTGSSGKSAEAINTEPVLPHDPSKLRLTDESHHQQLEHRAPLRLSGPAQDVEDVEFKEAPIKVKSRNPHAKLKTKETAMASAVRGAIDAAPILAAGSGVVGAIKASESDLPSNDLADRSADPTLKIDNGEGAAAAGAADSAAPGLLATAASALFGGKKGAAEEEKAKTGEEEGKIKEKTKVTGEDEKIKVNEGEGKIGAEAEGVAGEVKGASKFFKNASKIGKAAGIIGVGLTAVSSGMEYANAEDMEKAGKITAQQAKEQKAHAVGGGLGSVIGGYIGSTVGGIAWSLAMPGVGTFVGGAAGGYMGAKAGEWVGDELGSWWAKPSDQEAAHAVHQASVAEKAASKTPVIVHAPVTTQAAPSSKPQAVPVKAEPRSRESYFDRQMMNTVWF